MAERLYTIEKDDNYLYLKLPVDKIPPLYMFLPINEYSIHHFVTETLWGSLPSSFNDPFDSTGTMSYSIIQKLLDDYYQIKPDCFDPMIPKEQTCEAIKRALIETFQEARDNYIISCFTPHIKKEIMWAHYGRCGRGFALQYSAKDIISCARQYIVSSFDPPNPEEGYKLFPVYYSDEPVYLTAIITKLINEAIEQIGANKKGEEYEYNNEDIPFLQMVYRKNTCWSYEEEYRLSVLNYEMYTSNKSDEYVCLGHCKPTALYLGYNISKENEETLIEIAKGKNIPVYKIRPIIDNNKYELKEDKV